ncbi:hypothetical protein ACQKNX_07650 [Lysinibacillus sp. NPDC093712]|uniref:hypothetical protein n=1 Tax=Lysinibacillus sp. NPDC093712 TaxID=3390579 RepID=UPI003D02EE0E
MKEFAVRNISLVSSSLLFWSWFWYLVKYESIEAVIFINLISLIGVLVALITDLYIEEDLNAFAT